MKMKNTGLGSSALYVFTYCPARVADRSISELNALPLIPSQRQIGNYNYTLNLATLDLATLDLAKRIYCLACQATDSIIVDPSFNSVLHHFKAITGSESHLNKKSG